MKHGLSYLFCLFLLIAAPVDAQELRCNINLVTTQVQGSNLSVTEALRTALYEFANTRVWTNNVYTAEERIECNMMLNITSLVGSEFSGTISVQARRPIFNAIISTNLINFQDKDLKFNYVEGQPLEFRRVLFRSMPPTKSQSSTKTIVHRISI